jgi:hypothetical protein
VTTLEQIEARATAIQQQGAAVTRSAALDAAAREFGFRSYAHAQRVLNG